jgi:hypothetical protein
MPYQLTNPQLVTPDGPRIVRDIPYKSENMPDSARYDDRTQTIYIGTTGQIAPVPAAVWEYRVGGMRIVDKWISYRLKVPRGRPSSSPLDERSATNWTRAFNDDLLNLLQVLRQIVDLHPAQDAILDKICVGRIIDTSELFRARVFPVPKSATRPQRQHSDPNKMAI